MSDVNEAFCGFSPLWDLTEILRGPRHLFISCHSIPCRRGKLHKAIHILLSLSWWRPCIAGASGDLLMLFRPK
ncbi:hypothetical protein VN97_g10127 [Penicillium thymicola]|uniref:Uncharacterized protein n=1 Tax=Penicillium thymicola TaxID=293382 RepID=A0AAI9TAP1_PENTH|nr:hypothetical protein VN97_g10127 [Penicillium thymicola]